VWNPYGISEPKNPWGRRQQEAAQPIYPQMPDHRNLSHDAVFMIGEEGDYQTGNSQSDGHKSLGSTASEAENPWDCDEQDAQEPVRYAMNTSGYKTHVFSFFSKSGGTPSLTARR
jgi:hypothetical protein